MSKLEVLRSIWGFCHEKKNCRWAVFVPIVVNHKWNHLISDHPFLSDSFLFRKIYHAMLQLVWQNPLEKHGKKQVITFLTSIFISWSCFEGPLGSSIQRWLNFPFRICRDTQWHMQKIPRRCQEFPMFSLLGVKRFFCHFLKRQETRFLLYISLHKLLKTVSSCMAGRSNKKYCGDQTWVFRKRMSQVSWETKRTHPTPPNATVSPPRNCQPY